MKNPFTKLANALAHRLFGFSGDEILYTIEDVRSEIRAVRKELKGEIADLRRDLESYRGGDRPKGMEIPVAEA